MFDEPGGEVLGGRHPAALDQPVERADHVGVARHGGLRAARHVAGGLDQAVVVLLRHADDRAHHHHREPLGELADQLDTAGTAEVVDEPVAVPVDVATHAAGVDAPHAVGDRAAQPFVLGALGERAHRLPGEERGERVVRRHAAVLQGAPASRVAGELRGGTGHVEVLGVPEHQPGGHVLVQQDGGHRAVFGTQLLVETRGVRLGLGTVQPAQSAGADTHAVRGALRGRHRSGGRSGFVLEGVVTVAP